MFENKRCESMKKGEQQTPIRVYESPKKVIHQDAIENENDKANW